MKLNTRLFSLTWAVLLTVIFCPKTHAINSDLKPVNLRTEYKIDPVVDAAKPRLSWELNSNVRGQMQTGSILYSVLKLTGFKSELNACILGQKITVKRTAQVKENKRVFNFIIIVCILILNLV